MSKDPCIGLRKLIQLITLCIMLCIIASPAYPSEVLIVGNKKLKPVADVIDNIKQTVKADVTVISPADAMGNLEVMVGDTGVKAVIALGSDALIQATSLPDSVPVVYGLVIDPVETERKNITGVYMSTPVEEYISFIRDHFPAIKKIGIICPGGKMEHLVRHADIPDVELIHASTPIEFVHGLKNLGPDIDALLLLPERALITSKVLDELYLFSFKEKVPVIGISEKYVKIGSLFSLGFDPSEMGRQIGEVTWRVLAKGNAAGIRQSPPDKLNLFINSRTSEIMSVTLPEGLIETAKKVYP